MTNECVAYCFQLRRCDVREGFFGLLSVHEMEEEERQTAVLLK